MIKSESRSANRAVILARLRCGLWLTAFAGYTYLLVVPSEWLPPWLRATTGTRITEEFTFGKLLHAIWYGLFTLTAYWLPLGRRGLLWCIALLSFHGFATEYIQTFTGRNGRWLDVLIDHIGIAVGLLLCGLWYGVRRRYAVGRRPKRVPTSPEV
jgi:hypothetical protein